MSEYKIASPITLPFFLDCLKTLLDDVTNPQPKCLRRLRERSLFLNLAEAVTHISRDEDKFSKYYSQSKNDNRRGFLP